MRPTIRGRLVMGKDYLGSIDLYTARLWLVIGSGARRSVGYTPEVNLRLLVPAKVGGPVPDT
jgi:hypothetical protein